MMPKGLVKAASSASQTLRPMRSHSRASSLTRAMLTARKVFSKTLTISAAFELALVHEVAQLVVLDVGDVVLAAVDALGAVGKLLDADDVVADLRLFDGEREADVAEPDDADDGGVVLDLAEQALHALGDLGL